MTVEGVSNGEAHELELTGVELRSGATELEGMQLPIFNDEACMSIRHEGTLVEEIKIPPMHFCMLCDGQRAYFTSNDAQEPLCFKCNEAVRTKGTRTSLLPTVKVLKESKCYRLYYDTEAKELLVLSRQVHDAEEVQEVTRGCRAPRVKVTQDAENDLIKVQFLTEGRFLKSEEKRVDLEEYCRDAVFVRSFSDEYKDTTSPAAALQLLGYNLHGSLSCIQMSFKQLGAKADVYQILFSPEAYPGVIVKGVCEWGPDGIVAYDLRTQFKKSGVTFASPEVSVGSCSCSC